MAHEEELAKFIRWYVAPIDALRALGEGDGGFAALMVAIPWYERLLDAKRRLVPEFRHLSFSAARAKDWNLDVTEAEQCWAILRNGFAHQAMGVIGGRTKSLLGWEVSSEAGYEAVPRIYMQGPAVKVCLDIWLFADRVRDEFLARPEFIDASKNFPLASVYVMADDTGGYAVDWTNVGFGSGPGTTDGPTLGVIPLPPRGGSGLSGELTTFVGASGVMPIPPCDPSKPGPSSLD